MCFWIRDETQGKHAPTILTANLQDLYPVTTMGLMKANISIFNTRLSGACRQLECTQYIYIHIYMISTFRSTCLESTRIRIVCECVLNCFKTQRGGEEPPT